MSRRNRYALESSPLPPLPEVDTSSTIDASAQPQIMKFRKQLLPDVTENNEARNNNSSAQSVPPVAQTRSSLPFTLTTETQPITGDNIPLVELEPSTARVGKISAISVDLESHPSDKRPPNGLNDYRKTAKSPSFLDDIRTTFVRGFSRREDDRVRGHAGPSVYNSSLPVLVTISTTSLRDQEPNNTIVEGPLDNQRRPELAFPFLDKPYSTPRLPSQVGRTHSDISIPEGSTVGNIYKHYMDDEALDSNSDDGSLSDMEMALPEVKPASPSDFNSQSRSQPSKLFTRERNVPTFREKLQLRTVRTARSKPPRCSLPTAPHIAHQKQETVSISSGFAHINSYGNTRDLLSLTPGSQYIKVQASDQQTPDTPKVYIDTGDGNPVMYISEEVDQNLYENRVPLGREVSNALRRASAQSVYSAGSITDSIITRYRHFGQRAYSSTTDHCTFDPQQYVEITLPPDANIKTASIVHNPCDQPHGFYDEGVLSPSWVYGSQHNVVRIPISHVSPPISPPAIPKAIVKPAGGSSVMATDDGNDWETIGTRNSLYSSAKGQVPRFGLIGGTIGRAGSSIADISDEGRSNLTFEVDDIRSTNRIAQHPAQSGYKVDYRQRSLKDTRAPVFAPQYRIHNVNGFLSNSSRLHPQPSKVGGRHKTTLSIHHKNPFKRTPPQVETVHTPPSSGSGKQNRRYLTTFKPSLQTLNTDIDEEDYTVEIAPPSAFQHLPEQDRKKKALKWMEHFDEHKLRLTIYNNDPQTPCPDSGSKPSLFHNEFQSAVTNGSGVFSVDGYASPKKRKLRPLKLAMRNYRDGAMDVPSTITPTNSRKTSSKDRLRDLALVQKLYPQTNRTLSMSGSQTARSEDFVYRSPLAPPHQRRWKDLYSPSQLFGFQQAAKADTLDVNGHAYKTSSTTNSTHVITSQKHLFERPTLRAWNRDEATSTDLTHQKRNCSILVLCICTIFPPLLLVYIVGGLNGVITWWTDGLYTSYAKGQKRLALILLVAWSVAVFVGLVVFLALWFSRLR